MWSEASFGILFASRGDEAEGKNWVARVGVGFIESVTSPTF